MTLELAYEKLGFQPPLDFELSQRAANSHAGQMAHRRRIGTTTHVQIECLLDAIRMERSVDTRLPSKWMLVNAPYNHANGQRRDMARMYETLGGKHKRSKGPNKGLPRHINVIEAREFKRKSAGQDVRPNDIYIDPCGALTVTGPQRLIRRIDHDPRRDFDTFSAVTRDCDRICDMNYDQVMDFLRVSFLPIEMGVMGQVMEVKYPGLVGRFT